jgi:hypothetical protein
MAKRTYPDRMAHTIFIDKTKDEATARLEFHDSSGRLINYQVVSVKLLPCIAEVAVLMHELKTLGQSTFKAKYPMEKVGEFSDKEVEG